LGFPTEFSVANCEDNESIDYSWESKSGVDYYIQIRSELAERANFSVTVVQSECEADPSTGIRATSAPTPSIPLSQEPSQTPTELQEVDSSGTATCWRLFIMPSMALVFVFF
jgi:hypothetical protein